MKRLPSALIILVLFAVASPLAVAQERIIPPSSFSTFRQIRGGSNASLLKSEEESVIAVSADYLTDVMSPVAGMRRQGNRQASFIGCLFLGAELDMDGAFGAKGSSFFVQGLVTHGGLDDIGLADAQGMSGLQSPPIARLYQMWVQQKLFDDRLSLLAGIHDVNTEFNITDSAALFLNSSFGMGPEFAMSGINGASTYPATTLAARVGLQLTKKVDVKAALYNGVSGNLINPLAALPTFRFGGQDGVMAISELGLAHSIGGQPGKVSVAAWNYSRVAESRGGYLLVDQKIYSPSPGAEMGLYGFVRGGFTPNQAAVVTRSIQTGMSYRGPFGRHSDQIGVGLAVAAARRPSGLFGHEQTYELTYQAKLTETFALQPDLQWVVNPGMVPTRASGIVAGFRAQMAL